MQTLALARLCPDCRITAIDVHQPFLDDLMHRAKNAGLDKRIGTHQASMDNLPFTEASFDIIWLKVLHLSGGYPRLSAPGRDFSTLMDTW